MIVIGNTIISDDLINIRFVCDLSKCMGACCVEGDAGAPLEEEEISIIEDIQDDIKPYMSEKGLEIIEKTGVFDYDSDGNFVTPLINNCECAFVVFESGIAMCAIENAFLDGLIKFKKPISCHLYPVRITKHESYDAVNYHKWQVCSKVLECGSEQNVPLFEFLKEPLIRKYGISWFNKLKKEISSPNL